jgi:hypothetical protein
MISNRHNLPAPFVALFGRQQYSKGDSHWSVTQLVSPPKIAVLRAEHAAAIAAKEDLSDRFWSLMGSNIHKILEGASAEDHVVEERIHTTVHGMRISGQIDLQRHKNGKVGIIDYKFTSVYSVSRPKPEWEQQLNAYAYLLRKEKGLEVESLHVCAILRDWRLTDVSRRKVYPPAPVVMAELPVWSYEDQAKWVEERVMGLMQASSAYHIGEELPRCSDEDMWLRDGDPIRCRNYCDVREYCGQWARFQEEENASKKYELLNGSGPEGSDPAPKKARRRKGAQPADGTDNAADGIKDPE